MSNLFSDLPDEENVFSAIPDEDDLFSKLPTEKSVIDPAVKTVRGVAQVVPALEAGATAVSGVASLPIAGLAGLGTLATNSMGLTDTPPEEVINRVSSTLTYQPKTELGQHLLNQVMMPLEKLEEGAKAAGNYVLDKTGSPAAATAVDTAIQVLPFGGAAKVRSGGKPKPDVALNEQISRAPDEPPKVAENPQPIDLKPIAPEKAAEVLESTVKEIPDKAGNINLTKIDSSDSVKAAITQVSETFKGQIDDSRRGVITHKETQALADTLGMTPEKLLSRRKGQAFNAEEALGARQLLVESTSDLVKLSEAARLGGKDSLAAFQNALVRHVAIQEQVAGMTAEAGRALNQFKITAKSEKAKLDQLDAMIERYGGSGQIERLADAIGKLDDPAAIAKFARDSLKAKPSDMLLETWINALLSGPQTHAVNVTSNSLVAAWTIPEQFLSAAIGKLHAGDKVYMREPLARMYGAVQGAKEGLIAGGKTFFGGEGSDLFTKIEVRRQNSISAEGTGLTGIPGKVADGVGAVVRTPGRALMAEDEFFKAIGYRMELNALAMREGLKSGLKGKDLAVKIEDIKANPPEGIHLAAIDNARYQTFTKPLGDLGSHVQRFSNSHPAAKLIMPFIRTPTNIVKFAGERSPFALLSKNVRAEIAKGGAARDTAIAKMALGSTIGAVVAELASEGMITGGGPKNPDARNTLRATGWAPYSIKVGDEYYAYSRLEPLGMILGTSADYSEISGMLEKKEADAIAAQIVFAITNNLTSKTWLKGVSDLVEAIQDPERYGESWVHGYAGTLIPTGVAQVARNNDPVLRRTDSVIDRIKSRTPGYSKDLLPKRNIWGEPIILQGGLGPDMISPVYSSRYRNDKTSDEVVRLGINVTRPDKKIGGVDLTPEQHDEYSMLAGRFAKQTIDKLTSNPSWEKIPDPVKKENIRKIIIRARAIAREQIQNKYPDIVEQGMDLKIKELMGN